MSTQPSYLTTLRLVPPELLNRLGIMAEAPAFLSLQVKHFFQ
jgi:hypothetical protein